MIHQRGDRRFCGIKSIGYTELVHDLKKDDITGHAIDELFKFIEKYLDAPTYRKIFNKFSREKRKKFEKLQCWNYLKKKI